MAAGNETFVDYKPYLNQVEVWPRSTAESDGKVEEVVIDEMSPQHAIAAYRKLGRWTMDGSTSRGAMPTWLNVKKGLLARELLRQACGEEVVYHFELENAEAGKVAAVRAKEQAERASQAHRSEASEHARLRQEAVDRLDEVTEELVAYQQGEVQATSLGKVLSGTGVTIVINAGGRCSHDGD